MPRSVGLKLTVEGHSLRKPQLAQDRSQGKLPSVVPIVLPPVHSRPQGRAIYGPQPGPMRGKPVPLGRWNHHCLPSSATTAPPQHPGCCAECHGVLQQLSFPSGSSALAYCLPPGQGVCSTTPKSARKPHRLPAIPCQGAAPTRAGTQHLGQLSPTAGRRQMAAPRHTQKTGGAS